MNRRSFFQMGLASLATLPLASKVFASACPASAPAGKAVATETDPMASKLEYVADNTKSKNALHKAGDTCGGCKFYQKAKTEGGYAPCPMVGNKYVSSCGWCKSFKKA